MLAETSKTWETFNVKFRVKDWCPDKVCYMLQMLTSEVQVWNIIP